MKLVLHGGFYQKPLKAEQVCRLKDFEAWILDRDDDTFIANGNIYTLKFKKIAGSVGRLTAVEKYPKHIDGEKREGE
jgi:hypothetical protein